MMKEKVLLLICSLLIHTKNDGLQKSQPQMEGGIQSELCSELGICMPL